MDDFGHFRDYRIKKVATEFFCPLCSTPRSFRYSPRLSNRQYGQIAFTSFLLVVLSWNIMQAYSLILAVMVWASTEFWVRSQFRKEIPCPHCGFDASWYKRDVKVARRLVQEFWDKNKK